MAKTTAVLLFLTALVGCVSFNGYVKFYQPYADARQLPDAQLLAEGQQPKVYTSSNLERDVPDVESNHYIVIGISSFNGPQSSIAGVEEVCRKTGATFALVFSRYTDTRNVQGTIAVPNSTTTTISGSVYSSGGSGWYQGSATSHGTSYLPYSYNVDRYDQTAVYFVKAARKLRFGASWNDLNTQQRQQIGRNAGVFVRVVYKETPAFSANLMPGDVIVSVNAVEIRDVAHLRSVLDAVASGTEVDVGYLRNGASNTATVKLQ